MKDIKLTVEGDRFILESVSGVIPRLDMDLDTYLQLRDVVVNEMTRDDILVEKLSNMKLEIQRMQKDVTNIADRVSVLTVPVTNITLGASSICDNMNLASADIMKR